MTKNTIWVTGAEGRLGSALVQLLSQDIDNKVIGTDKAEVDITDMAAIRTGEIDDLETKEKIDRLHRINLHKLRLMPAFEPEEL